MVDESAIVAMVAITANHTTATSMFCVTQPALASVMHALLQFVLTCLEAILRAMEISVFLR